MQLREEAVHMSAIIQISSWMDTRRQYRTVLLPEATKLLKFSYSKFKVYSCTNYKNSIETLSGLPEQHIPLALIKCRFLQQELKPGVKSMNSG